MSTLEELFSVLQTSVEDEGPLQAEGERILQFLSDPYPESADPPVHSVTGPTSGPSPASQGLALLLSPEHYSDAVMDTRPTHRKLIANLLKGQPGKRHGVVAGLLNTLRRRLGPLTDRNAVVSLPPYDCLQAAATLVLVSQRWALNADELHTTFEALFTVITVMRSPSLYGSRTATDLQRSPEVAEETDVSIVVPSPPGSIGAVLEDTAYLLSVTLMNAARPAEKYDEMGALWDRSTADRATNPLTHDGRVTAIFEGLQGWRGHAQNGHVYRQAANVGAGDRRTRELAAGYFAMVLASGFALLRSRTPDAAGDARLAQGIRLHLVSMAPPPMPGARVRVATALDYGELQDAIVEAVDDNSVRVRLQGGAEWTVTHEEVVAYGGGLVSRCWQRALLWFPSFYGAGLKCALSAGQLQQCLAASLDAYLRLTWDLVAESVHQEQSIKYSSWLDDQRQSYRKQQSGYSWGQMQYPALLRRRREQKSPQLSCLEDVLRLTAFLLGPADARHTPPGGRREEHDPPPAWKLQLGMNLLQTRGSSGLVRFYERCRGSHEHQSLVGWVVEQSQGAGWAVSQLDPTALSLLSSYLDLHRGLCMGEGFALEVYRAMSGLQSNSSDYLSLDNLLLKEDSITRRIWKRHIPEQRQDTANRGQQVQPQMQVPLSDDVAAFLRSSICLAAAVVDSNRQPWEHDSPAKKCWTEASKPKPLKQFDQLILLELFDNPVGRNPLGGTALSALSAWCSTHDDVTKAWTDLLVRQGLPGTIPGLLTATGGGEEWEPLVNAEIRRERRLSSCPCTAGCLRLVLRILTTFDWTKELQVRGGDGARQQTRSQIVAASHVRWLLKEVFCCLEEIANQQERWAIAILCLRLIQASLRVPSHLTGDAVLAAQPHQQVQPTEGPAAVVWSLAADGELIERLLGLAGKRAGPQSGEVMDRLLVESLDTIHLLLITPAPPTNEAPQQVGVRRPGAGRVAQMIATWKEGSFVTDLTSEEWQNVRASEGRNQSYVGETCVRILLALARAGCRLSHYFISDGRGNTEDASRIAENTLIAISEKVIEKLRETPQGEANARALEERVLQPIENGVRVRDLEDDIERTLLAYLEGPEAPQELRNFTSQARSSLSVFVKNLAEGAQILFTSIMDSDDPADPVLGRQALVCKLIQATTGARHYSIAHLLCGVPERYVEARGRSNEHDVFGTRRRNVMTVMVERLSDPAWISRFPNTAMHYLTTVVCLARDTCLCRATLRYLQSANVVETAFRQLRPTLQRLSLTSPIQNPEAFARDTQTCASIFLLVTFDMHHRMHDGVGGHQTVVRELVSSAGGSSGLLLEAGRCVGTQTLPPPIQIERLLFEAGAEGAAASLLLPSLYGGECEEEDVINAAAEIPRERAVAQQKVFPLVGNLRQALASRRLHDCVVQYMHGWTVLATDLLRAVFKPAEIAAPMQQVSNEIIDNTIFQAALDVITQMDVDLSRGDSVDPARAVGSGSVPYEAEQYRSRTCAVVNAMLGRTLNSFIEAMNQRAEEGAPLHGTPGQLCRLLGSLLNALIAAGGDPALRVSLYESLIALLHYARSPGDEEGEFVDAVASSELRADLSEMFQLELGRKWMELCRRIGMDVSKETDILLQARAWTTLRELVPWSRGGGLPSLLRQRHSVDQYLQTIDARLCESLRRESRGDESLALTSTAFRAFTGFLNACAATPDGAADLTQYHQLIRHLSRCRFLRECAQQLRSSSSLMQQRAAALLHPIISLAARLAARAREALVSGQLQDLLKAHPGLLEQILQPPYNFGSENPNFLDLDYVRLVAAAVLLLAEYAGAVVASAGKDDAGAVQSLHRLGMQLHLTEVLARFGSRATWERVVHDPQFSDRQELLREARDVVGYIVHDTMRFFHYVISGSIDAAPGEITAWPIIFERAFEFEDTSSSASGAGSTRADISLLARIAADLFSEVKLIEAEAEGKGPSPGSVHQPIGHDPLAAVHGRRLNPRAQRRKQLQRVHTSVVEVMGLLHYHIQTAYPRDQDSGSWMGTQGSSRFTKRELPDVLRQAESYAQWFAREATDLHQPDNMCDADRILRSAQATAGIIGAPPARQP
eukprot:Hpha_TRINITY_DN16516_c1_g20::TRINITY_DN16516_c1_g20_i1::g.136878::m.136878